MAVSPSASLIFEEEKLLEVYEKSEFGNDSPSLVNMEGTEVTHAGVTIVGAEAPLSYHVSAKNEIPVMVSGCPAVETYCENMGPLSSGMKKKRGRPRKYGPDGMGGMMFSPLPLSSSAPSGINISFGGKHSRDRGSWFENKRNRCAEINNSDCINNYQDRCIIASDTDSEWVSSPTGANFTPHIVTINAGEDITMKIISFSQQGPRATCILSANGSISNVTLRQPDSSGGTLTYEGRFEILSLTGSFTPTENGGTRGRAGGLSVSLASPDGRVLGGGVAGLLVAATPVQVVVGSFLPSNQHEQRVKKFRNESEPTPISIANVTAIEALTAAVSNPTFAGIERSSRGIMRGSFNSSMSQKTMTNAAASTLPPFHIDNWNGPSERESPADINISLPVG